MADELELARGRGDHSSRVHPDIPNKPGKTNWVEQGGGLPSFIERVAKHILHDTPGMTVSRAIASAVSQVKKWAAKGNAKAIKAVAQWEALKGKAAARRASRRSSED